MLIFPLMHARPRPLRIPYRKGVHRSFGAGRLVLDLCGLQVGSEGSEGSEESEGSEGREGGEGREGSEGSEGSQCVRGLWGLRKAALGKFGVPQT